MSKQINLAKPRMLGLLGHSGITTESSFVNYIKKFIRLYPMPNVAFQNNILFTSISKQRHVKSICFRKRKKDNRMACNITKGDITEVKSLASPPKGVVDVLSATVLLLGEQGVSSSYGSSGNIIQYVHCFVETKRVFQLYF